MRSSYYYLAAGLPPLALDETRAVASLREWCAEIDASLEPNDKAFLRCVRYPFDNANIVALLEQHPGSFDPRGNFSAEDLARELKSPDDLPEYATVFLAARQENRELFSGLYALDQLSWLFYEEMAQSAEPFIREWFEFDCDFRNVLAALSVRERAERTGEDIRASIARVVVGRTLVAEQVRRSSAPDFGLGAAAPWAAAVCALPRTDLVAFEKAIDQIRWRTLDELTILEPFSLGTLLAFCIKLTIVERWMALDAVEGRKRLLQLVQELTSGTGSRAA